MSDYAYARTTRECAPAQLMPELLQAIRDYAVQHELGLVETESLRDIQVSAFNSQLIPDTGLDVRNAGAGLEQPVDAFIPLGPEAAASITERVSAPVSNAI